LQFAKETFAGHASHTQCPLSEHDSTTATDALPHIGAPTAWGHPGPDITGDVRLRMRRRRGRMHENVVEAET